MRKTIDRAGILKLGGMAGIATLIESVASAEKIAAAPVMNPMNLTMKTSAGAKRTAPQVYYKLMVTANNPGPSAVGDMVFQTHAASGVDVDFDPGSEFPGTHNHQGVGDKWITIYVKGTPWGPNE